MSPLLVSTLRGLFHAGGGVSFIRRWRPGVRILMYHHFPHGVQDSLDSQCVHIRKCYHPASLTEISSWLRAGRHPPRDALAVTVDDGYRDFLQVAAPVFAAHRIPVTVFLTTGFLDRECWLWVDRVRLAFRRTQASQVEIPLPSGSSLRFELALEEQRASSAFRLQETLKRLPDAECRRVVDELPRRLGVALPEEPPAEYEPLRWDEVRRLARDGFDFGSHTRTHAILSRLGGDRLREEVEESKRRIESELAMPVRHFCYPNGRWGADISPEAVEASRRAGYETAVTTDCGVNSADADPLLLKRIGVEPGLPELYFRECAACFRLRAPASPYD